MPTIIDDTLLSNKKNDTPALVGWNRLEPRPRSDDFSRSLKAEIRDALWMLSRQWQMGEFKGEDAGSPVDTRLLTVENAINRYAVKNQDAVLFDYSIPLETKVERENIPDSFKLKIQVSTQFSKILNGLSVGKDYNAIIRSAYPVSIPSGTEMSMTLCNQESDQLYEQARVRSFDGYKLIQDLQSGAFNTWVNNQAAIVSADKTHLINAGLSLLKWFKRIYSQPDPGEEQAWSMPYLEYQFTCATPSTSGEQTILTAEQYASGHLDWYSFNVDKSKTALSDKEMITDTTATTQLVSFIPSPISFSGMPNPRYWEMEDRNTDFGSINANTTDDAKLIVAEFGLIYSNDWFILPYSMDTGKICEIRGMIVTDSFGDRTFIRAAGEGVDDEWQTWRLFNMSVDNADNSDMRLLLSPSVTKVLQSEPVEKINLIRDEMANMVWGIESIITLPSGNPKKGFEAAKEFTAYLTGDLVETNTNLEASVKYTLGTTVTENWIPFISVHAGTDNREIQMQRAAMPRETADGLTLVQPRTALLQGANPFYIHEEEVPRSGTIVTKSFQRARWYNGKIVLWLGRKVTNGKGEGNSGLKFDEITKI